jgi:hypothetical protein
VGGAQGRRGGLRAEGAHPLWRQQRRALLAGRDPARGRPLLRIINNEPVYAKQVKAGERYEFGDAEISDWLFMRNGKMVGNETMRPLLKQLPQEEADEYRRIMETP